MRAVLWLAVLLLLPVGIARAQVGATGQISGTVVDPSGKLIPNAEVTVSSPATKFTQTVKANSSGEYVFPSLETGTYEIAATAQGFARAVYSSVVVNVAQTTNLQIKMAIGTASQTVTVSAVAQVLQTTQNTLSTNINPTMIENLPLNGRDLLEFALLATGASYMAGEGQRYTTYDNLPNAANNITVNGTDNNFQRYKEFSTGFFTAAPLREGAFDEATVSTNGLTAESGAEGASQIRFVTKRGGSQFHGRAFWQTVNSFFNANSFTNNALQEATHGKRGKLPKTRNNFFGGNFGGPLLPRALVGNHRTYFFVNLEYNKVPGSSFRSNNVLTSDAANGLYTYDVTSIPAVTPPWVTGCDAAALTCTANLYTLAADNGLPATEDSTVAGLLSQISAFYPKGTLEPLSTTPAGLYTVNEQYLQSLVWSRPSLTDQWYPTTRLDVDVTSKIHWSDSWDLYWRNIHNTTSWPGSKYAGSGFKSTYYTWSNNVTWTISPTLLDQFSFGIEGTIEEFNPGSIADPYGVLGERQFSMPFGIPALVPGFILPVPRDNPLWNPSDSLTWTRGSHTFTFGASMIYSNMFETENQGPASYAFGLANGDPALAAFSSGSFPNMSARNGNRDLNSAQSLYSFLTGRLTSVSGGNWLDTSTNQFVSQGNFRAEEAQTYGGIYFQDGWRVNPHITVNYGLRWEFSGAVHNTANNYFIATVPNLLGPSTHIFKPGLLNGIQTPTIGIFPAPYHGDFKQPAPNFGFAWNPDIVNGFLGKILGGNGTVIRGGFSLNPYNSGWETFENASVYTNPGTFQSVFFGAGNPGIPGQFAPGTEFLTSPNVTPAAIAANDGFPAAFQTAIPESEFAFTGTVFAGVDPNIKSPYVEQWNFGIQRQLPGNFVVEVDYVGNHAVHIWQDFNLNEVNATSNGFLTDFKNGINNYNINSSNGQQSFADNTGYAGIVATPSFDAAFNGNGVTTGANDPGGYANPGFIFDLQTGQAGGLALTLSGSSIYLCNMVGSSFAPCGNVGGNYPINYFQPNPYAGGSNVTILSDPGSSTYNGLQVSWRHPAGHGLSLGGNYTFSKSLSSRFLSFFTDTAQENYISLRDMALNKGVSDFDLRNVFNTYFTYELPLGKGRTFNVSNSILNAVVGGWNVGSIIQIQGGLPFWIQGGYNSFNDEDGGVVLNGVTYKQVQSNIGVYKTSNGFAPVDWLNPNFNAASAIVPEQTPGAIGQLLFVHGPKFVNTDISLNKTFPIYERVSLKVQASFLNAFNHPNFFAGGFGAPGYLASASSFSSPQTASAANSPRVIQWRTEIDF